MIHVFLGTKAQYIKTAPLLRLLEARGVPHRLIDSGQHGALSVGLREELGVRQPDLLLTEGRDVTSIPQALRWAAGIAAKLVDRDRLRREVFASRNGICVVHGDTPSTLLATLLARRAGLPVAHLEVGLRSNHLLHPFPEELIRVIVMRLAGLLFAPDRAAERNLRRMRVRGRVIPLPGNTVVEALHHELNLAGAGDIPPGAAVVTLHRVENLNRRERVEQLVALVERLAASDVEVVFVQHGPTIDTLRRRGLGTRLERAGVRLTPLLAHAAFVALLRAAPFVITDGGSIQEECALLGTPTLLWRAATEREDGLGANVVLSGYDASTIEAFLADPQAYRRPPVDMAATPSEVVLAELQAYPGPG